MAIKINYSGDPNQRIEPPIVSINGNFMEDRGVWGSKNIVYDSQHEVLSGTTVTARSVDAFRRAVTVTITCDASTRRGFDAFGPPFKSTVRNREINNNNVFVGEQPGGLIQNELIYTYYTLNGKDPKRTKANLYTGPFTVRQNASGTDNYILKTRSYVNGISSKVKKVEFRIVNDQSDALAVNRNIP